MRADHCGCQTSQLAPGDFSCWYVECILSVCVCNNNNNNNYVCVSLTDRAQCSDETACQDFKYHLQTTSSQTRSALSHDGPEWDGRELTGEEGESQHRWRSRRAVRYMKRYIAARVKSIGGIFRCILMNIDITASKAATLAVGSPWRLVRLVEYVA